MINREIIYERDIYKSYMKIPAVTEENMDEKIMLRKSVEGLLPVEKYYLNGKGQYWYNITGKQALDVYCRENVIGSEFFKELILRLCKQVEEIGWNLLDTSCLVVDPELIFVGKNGKEFSFVFYPQRSECFFDEIQFLMEYLLTKINHEDDEVVNAAYRVYEITLNPGYDVADLKAAILEAVTEAPVTHLESVTYEAEPIFPVKKESSLEVSRWLPVEKLQALESKLTEMFEKVKEILQSRPEDLLQKKTNTEEIPVVVYPEEELEEESMQIHPTICITDETGKARGILLYEGVGSFPDFELGKETCSIGKSDKARLKIERETISKLHAKIEFETEVYYIEDMNSTNGTFVNEKMLNYKEKRQLVSGDVIRFADVKYRFL